MFSGEFLPNFCKKTGSNNLENVFEYRRTVSNEFQGSSGSRQSAAVFFQYKKKCSHQREGYLGAVWPIKREADLSNIFWTGPYWQLNFLEILLYPGFLSWIFKNAKFMISYCGIRRTDALNCPGGSSLNKFSKRKGTASSSILSRSPSLFSPFCVSLYGPIVIVNLLLRGETSTSFFARRSKCLSYLSFPPKSMDYCSRPSRALLSTAQKTVSQ